MSLKLELAFFKKPAVTHFRQERDVFGILWLPRDLVSI